MPTKKRVRELNDRKYERFLRELDPVYLSLINAAVEFNPTVYNDIGPRKKDSMKKAISARYKLEDIKEEFLEATANFKLTIEDEKTPLKLLLIECTFLGHFHGESPLEKNLAERFANSTFRLVVWPYFRQFVNDMTARMSIPPVIIPLLVQE